MKKLLVLEEIGQFLLAIVLYAQIDYSWWLFPATILLPDISMIGYAINTKIGAWIYNIFHHKLIAIITVSIGFNIDAPLLILTGIILFAHSAMDRIFGYGLKYEDSFKHTHLGSMK